MIEIDFIPQWYRANRNRRRWYQRQILILSVIAILVALWSFVAGRGLSRARAELAVSCVKFESEIGKIQQYERLQVEYSALQTQNKILESIVPRTSYSAVLAELSHCVGADIVMKKLSLRSEPIDIDPRGNMSVAMGKTAKRNSAAGADETLEQPLPTQTRVILVGYAADAQGVAALISSLERSNYFFRVVPVYSKNGSIENRDIAEFEIQCILADFKLLSGKE
jgi:hypothetical protein